MTKNKKIAVSVLVFSLMVGLGSYGVNQTSAQGNDNRDSLIEKLTAKFNLNKDEVTEVFNQDREARRAEMDQKRQKIVEENLNSAVASGELTSDQKQLILNKLAELNKEREANREAHQNLSSEERKAEMTKHRAELEKWASDNGIDVNYLFGGFGKGQGETGMGRGMGNGGGQGMGK